ncbi:MAG TPA: (Fe-S)-binding protein [Xanthomonadales bacterium]|nr:(Fe-S)-binding protein [Xanthomonadales bacterium]
MESPPNVRAEPAELAIERLADQCVMCGLCLPHCPTYRVGRQEGESPRGRVALAKALVAGEHGAHALAHLDNCLACGSCAQVCPSKVEFVPLLVHARTIARRTLGEPALRPRLRALARRPGMLRALMSVRRAGMAHVAQRIASRHGLAPSATRAIARTPRAWLRGQPVAFTPAVGQRRGVLALFRGCAARVLDADTQQAAVHVLTHLGYDVHAPSEPHCCGALALHAGDRDGATHDAGEARALFAALGVDAVVHCTSGCDATLRQALGVPVHEVCAFVAREPSLELRKEPARKLRAALMVPCTQRGIADEALLLPLLARVPGVEATALPLQPRCCGAAGLHFADHEAISLPLREERVAQLAELAPDVVVTTNIGCRLYLQAGLLEAGLAIPVAHPVALLAEALPA